MRCARGLVSPVIVLVSLVACGTESDEIEKLGAARTTSALHSWNNFHWARTSNPFALMLGDNVSGQWDSFLITASNDWTDSSVLNTAVTAGGTRPRTCKATGGRVEVCNAKYGFNGWLGVATVWVSGDHITAGTVKVNDSYFTTARYDAPGWRALVMCQEIGHTLGLDHQDEIFDNPNLGTCMDYTSVPEGPPSNLHPNAHDYEQLESIYAHLDGTTTVGQPLVAGNLPPPAAGAANGAAPPEWGRLIRLSADGRLALYLLDLGGGNRVYRFVIWA